MAFWSGQKLAIELPRLNLIEPYDIKNIDCASYQLCLGEQAFVTKDDSLSSPNAELIQVLKTEAPSNTLTIGTGQFAFLLTEETIKVPANGIAFISMKSRLKNKGLVNVSGFHVDPGFNGKLTFAVYNAGPNKIILERGQKLFMIVYADLDQISSDDYIYNGQSQNQNSIETRMIEGMTGQVFSPMMLQRQMQELNKNFLDLGEKQSDLKKDLAVDLSKSETNRAIILWFIGIVIALFGISISILRSDFLQPTLGGFLKHTINTYNDSVKEDIKSTSADETQLPSPSVTNSIIINQPAKSIKIQKSKTNE